MDRNLENNINIKFQTRLLWAAAVCTLAVGILVGLYASLAPFGNASLVISDSDTQYTRFWMYYRDMLLGRQDPFYALEMGLGGNVIGLLGYYAASPLNLLFLLFPVENTAIAVHLILLIKLVLSSLTMALYFRYTTGLRPVSLIFTTAYAFCGFSISYGWCLMWLDGLILLPLIALGLRKLKEEEKPGLYMLSLAAAIITNYYIGFILCIFSVLFFICLIIASGKKPSWRSLGDFAAASVLSGGLSAFILIPSLMSMQDGKRRPFGDILESYVHSLRGVAEHIIRKLIPSFPSEAAEKLPLIIAAALLIFISILIAVACSRKIKPGVKAVIFSAVSVAVLSYGAVFESKGFFMQKMLTGFCNFWEMMDGYPQIYSGIICLLLAVFYFICPGQDRNEKRAALFMLLVLLLSMHFFLPNTIWHGFTENSSFNYRYTFVFSFFVICLANKAFIKADKFKAVYIPLITGFIIALILIGKIYDRKLATDFQYLIITGEVMILALLIWLMAKSSGRRKKICLVLITALSMLSIFLQAGTGIRLISEDSDYSGSRESLAYTRELSDRMKTRDSGLYRAHMGTYMNGPMMFGYKGTTHFSSNEKAETVRFMDRLGIPGLPGIWASSVYGRTGAFDSFFGVKYTGEGEQKSFYNCIDRDLYENPAALPVIFEADMAVTKTVMDSENAFENQNRLFRAAVPQLGRDIFTEEKKVEKEYISLRQVSEHNYYPEENSDYGEIVYSFKVSSTDPIYFYSDNCRETGGELWLNGQFLCPYNNVYNWRCISLGSFEKGQRLELRLRQTNGEEYAIIDTGRFAYESTEALKEYRKAVMTDCRSSEINDRDLITELSTAREGSCLLYTIAYEKGWKAFADGEETQVLPAYGGLMAVPLSSGEHVIELIYEPAGIYPGAAISLLSAAAMIVFLHIKKNRRRA